jgi:site-specific DNA recombinase
MAYTSGIEPALYIDLGLQGKMQQNRPQEQWERVEVPDWRIVPEELWDAVRQECERRAGKVRQKQGGLNRTALSRQHIFSGLLKCGICDGRMNIVGMKNGNVRYGCAKYRFSGTCDNKMTIRRDVLEGQLIGALGENLSRDSVAQYLREEFIRQASVAWRAQVRKSEVKSEPNQLRFKGQQLRQQSENLLNAISDGAGSTLLCIVRVTRRQGEGYGR